MQVLDEKLPRFRERVLDEFKSSENYASLKKDRTRDASLAVLTYLANQGGGLVRRNKLKAVFVVGGADKSERLRDRETGDKSITSLRDNELQRILDNLILGQFVLKKRKKIKSTRSPSRSKRDAYYSIHFLRIQREDWMTGEDMEKQLEFEAFVKKHGVPAGPLIRTEIFRRELESMGYPNVSDRELEAYLQPFAKSYVHVDNDLILKWADKLPPEKWRLSLSLKKYIEDGGHVTRAYDVIE